jgi:hypothetical protein
MDSIIYKVIFKAIHQFENKNLTLNFKNLIFEKPITLPHKLIPKLKDLSEKSDTIIVFQNIEEVIIVGNVKPQYEYKYYLVILFTQISNEEKRGYLIGNVKNIGDIIIGIWPFNQQETDLTPETILENSNNLLKNPEQYDKICVISQ